MFSYASPAFCRHCIYGELRILQAISSHLLPINKMEDLPVLDVGVSAPPVRSKASGYLRFALRAI